MTPLHDAAFNGHKSLLAKLLHSHEPSTVKDILGFCAHEYMSSIGDPAEEVNTEKDRESPLTVPAPAPQPEPVEEPAPVPVQAAPAPAPEPVKAKGKKK
jgi:ankyrin repeat protein